MLRLELQDESATVAFGSALGKAANGGGIIYLEGELGAGKTTLCRGVLRAFGHEGAVKSPTYTLVEGYELPARTIYHFDLYRLGDPEELEYVGIRDYFSPGNLCLIEWPKRGEGFLPGPDLTVKVKVMHPHATSQQPGSQYGGSQPAGSQNGAGRQIEIIAHSVTGQNMFERLQNQSRIT